MGIIRLLIVAGLAYLLYRLVRGAMGSYGKISRQKPGGVIDEMVQDPQCKTYIPRREAKKRVIGGKTYFFCSEDCADTYEKEQKG
jgi:YHS domain-containing protein